MNREQIITLMQVAYIMGQDDNLQFENNDSRFICEDIYNQITRNRNLVKMKGLINVSTKECDDDDWCIEINNQK